LAVIAAIFGVALVDAVGASRRLAGAMQAPRFKGHCPQGPTRGSGSRPFGYVHLHPGEKMPNSLLTITAGFPNLGLSCSIMLSCVTCSFAISRPPETSLPQHMLITDFFFRLLSGIWMAWGGLQSLLPIHGVWARKIGNPSSALRLRHSGSSWAILWGRDNLFPPKQRKVAGEGQQGHQPELRVVTLGLAQMASED